MPFKSKAQRRKFYAMADRGEIPWSVVEEWEDATKGKKLPNYVRRKNPAKKPGEHTAAMMEGPVGGPKQIVLYDAGKFIDMDDLEDVYDEGVILGYMEFSDSDVDDSFYQINRAWAKKGWGPALYEYGAQAAKADKQHGLHTDVTGGATKAAQGVWAKFPNNRLRQVEDGLHALYAKSKAALNQALDIGDKSVRLFMKKEGYDRRTVEPVLFEAAVIQYEQAYAAQQKKERR